MLLLLLCAFDASIVIGSILGIVVIIISIVGIICVYMLL